MNWNELPAPNLMPRKYAANQPIFSKAGSYVTTESPHAEDGKQVCEWGFLTAATPAHSPGGLSTPCSRRRSLPTWCAVIFPWGPQGIHGHCWSVGLSHNTFLPWSHDTFVFLLFLLKVLATCTASWPCQFLPHCRLKPKTALSGFIGLFYQVSASISFFHWVLKILLAALWLKFTL